MNISYRQNGTEAIFEVEGRMDTIQAPMLEKEINEKLGDSTLLILDFAKLEYIASSGLRVLLLAHKTMTSKKGTLIVKNSNKIILDVLTITGFADILNLE